MTDVTVRGYMPPVPNLDTQWWWDALGTGRLTMPECHTCRYRFFPPQPFCPNCGSADWTPVEPDGRGRVYSWVVAHRAFGPEFQDDVPYGIVAVDMVDGGRLIGRYLGNPDELSADLPVRAEIYRVEGTALLGFRRI
jgi:hypothetical protein